MPPPTQSDPWLQGRRFGIVIDAGSSGSRLQIYSWKDARVERTERKGKELAMLPRVEKGTRNAEDWFAKIEPGISSYALEPSVVGSYLAPLLEHAQQQIPPSLHSSTPIYLLATAGMRLLPPEQQAQIIDAACTFFKFHSEFRVDHASENGPCGSSIRVITGEDEGLFGWIAINYLMDGFSSRDGQRATYGFLDMGGASTQIAFEPGEDYRQDPAVPLRDVHLRLLDGTLLHHQVFVTTWLGYGTNQARERYIGSIISHWDEMYGLDGDSPNDVVPDPCLPRDLTLYEAPVFLGPSSEHSQTPHTLKGTGSFPRCVKLVAPLLNKEAPCPDTHCLFNGVAVPPIDFSVSRFIGVSEYWYSSEHVFGLGGAYDFVQYERAATEFCSKDWDSITAEHFASKAALTPTSSDTRVHRRDVDLARLELQCFKAAWIVNVLHEGIGLPRIVDPGGNSTSSGPSSSDRFSDKADQKGLGAPAFQSMDTVGDTAITWTLGMMVLEASSEIPTTYIGSGALDDSDSYPDWDDGTLPFLGDLEDTLKDHLHPSLIRPIYGYSPISVIFFSLVALFVTYIFRYRLRSVYRKIFRPRSGYDYAQAYAMESGGLNGVSDLDSPPLTPLSNGTTKSKALPAFVRHALRRLRKNIFGISSPRLVPPEPALRPVRPPLPAPSSSQYQQSRLAPFGGASNANMVQRTASPASVTESTTPPSPTRSSALNPSLPNLSLSRNGSQVNLTTIMPRASSFIRGGGPR